MKDHLKLFVNLVNARLSICLLIVHQKSTFFDQYCKPDYYSSNLICIPSQEKAYPIY